MFCLFGVVCVCVYVGVFVCFAQVALWWRYTCMSLRRQALVEQKKAIADQLANLVTVSTTTMGNLRQEKTALIEERIALQDQVRSPVQLHVGVTTPFVSPCSCLDALSMPSHLVRFAWSIDWDGVVG
jgi:hypothetical protein